MAGVKKNSEIRKDSARQCSPGKKLSFSSSSSFPSCSDPSSFFKIMLGNFRDFLVCLLFSYFVAFFFSCSYLLYPHRKCAISLFVKFLGSKPRFSIVVSSCVVSSVYGTLLSSAVFAWI